MLTNFEEQNAVLTEKDSKEIIPINDVICCSDHRCKDKKQEIIVTINRMFWLPHLFLQCSFATTPMNNVGNTAIVQKNETRSLTNLDMIKKSLTAMLWQFIGSLLAPGFKRRGTLTDNSDITTTLMGLGAITFLSGPLEARRDAMTYLKIYIDVLKMKFLNLSFKRNEVSFTETNKRLQMEKEDLFRNPPVRFVGYSHEIVEALRQLMPLPNVAVRCGYALTYAYILSDAGSKAVHNDVLKKGINTEVLQVANNALLWQFFASIIVPRMAITGLKQISANFLRWNSKIRWNTTHIITTLLGLGAIPILSGPIDRMVSLMVPPHVITITDLKDPKKGNQVKTGMKEGKEYDIYRDSLVRYLGYCNEVGEAFRALVPRSIVKCSYGVSVSYCLCDTADKACKVRDKPGSTNSEIAYKAGDVLIWQLLASVIIPGFTINRISKGAGIVVKYYNIPRGRYIPTLIGLASIPIIIHPIDRMVDYLMDNTYRKYVQ